MKTNDVLRTLALNKGLQVVAVLGSENGERVFDLSKATVREYAMYGGKIFFDRDDFKKEYLKQNGDWIAEYPMKVVENILEDLSNQFFDKKIIVLRLEG